MAKFFIDGVEYEAKAGENLLQAALSQHLDLPYFCWHPSLGSVGACRQCAVVEYRDENDKKGRLSMACLTGVREGLRVSIANSRAADFRKTVIEWLMQNHPHDCPVCEEGGECHLQDMTVMTGHSVRRYRQAKRTWQNQDLGPFIGHEMNRCITCYRCVRFYADYAGGTDLGAFGSRGRMYFGRVSEGTLENEFSGNLVEVCPTGVFTDKPFAKQYTRKWDLQSSPSVCTGCSVGCNTFAAERYGQLRRVHNRYHADLNGYFICDRGRFGMHFVNSDKRIRMGGVGVGDGTFEARGTERVLETASALVRSDQALIGIGSPRASVESNVALKRLVGSENFCPGLADADAAATHELIASIASDACCIPTIAEIERADAVLVLGEDIADTAPRAALALRQAVRGVSFAMAQEAGIPHWQDAGVRGHAQDHRHPLFIACAGTSRLEDVAEATEAMHPEDAATFALDLAEVIAGKREAFEPGTFAARVSAVLADSKAPLVVSGTSQGNASLVRAARDLAVSLKIAGKQSMLLVAAREANSVGACMVGGSLSMSEALARMADGCSVVVLENDLYRRADAGRVNAALRASSVIVMDVLETPTADGASVALPAASFAESTGTYVNYECRAQRFYQTFQPEGEILPSWAWISRLASERGSDPGWDSIEQLTRQCAEQGFAGIEQAGPGSDYRFAGISKIARQTHRYSGRTAMYADETVHEPKSRIDSETAFAYSMEGANSGRQASATIPYVWSPGWNSNQSLFKFQQEISGPWMQGDPGVRLDPSWYLRHEAHPSDAESLAAEGEFRSVPIFPLFGSEEQSARSWPIVRRMPAPFAVLHPQDAARLGLVEGGGVAVLAVGRSCEVRLDAGMPPGVVGIAAGLPGKDVQPHCRTDLSPDPEFVRKMDGEPGVIARG